MIKGIDVSSHNGVIDWQRVKKAGIKFAIIRAGKGTVYDNRFFANIDNAKSAGIAVGVYWFCYAMSASEAIREAEICINGIHKYKPELPVYYDFEYNTEDYAAKQGIKYNAVLRTAIIRAFCERIRQAGYTAGIYTNQDYIIYRLDWNKLKEYRLFLAAHVPGTKGSFETTNPNAVNKSYNAEIWQFACGNVDGVPSDCDLDYGYFENSGSSDAVGQARTEYAAGGKYTIKSTDRYITGAAVPTRIVGNTYTIARVADGKILLREIMSWVRV